MDVLSVFRVCDEHRRPLFERQVGETEQVVVEGQDSVSDEEHTRDALETCAAALRNKSHQCDEDKTQYRVYQYPTVFWLIV